MPLGSISSMPFDLQSASQLSLASQTPFPQTFISSGQIPWIHSLLMQKEPHVEGRTHWSDVDGTPSLQLLSDVHATLHFSFEQYAEQPPIFLHMSVVSGFESAHCPLEVQPGEHASFRQYEEQVSGLMQISEVDGLLSLHCWLDEQSIDAALHKSNAIAAADETPASV